MSELKVHYASLQQAATDIRTAANHLRDQLSDLQAKVNRVAATWEGQTKEAYQATQREWDKRAQHMYEVLGDVARKVESASGSYQATDKKTAGYFGN